MRYLVILISLVFLCGCEEELNLSNEKDERTEAQVVADILKDTSAIYVGGNAADSKLDTVNAPIIIGGDITNVTANTAASAE